jgi:helix-hairpin-helix protein
MYEQINTLQYKVFFFFEYLSYKKLKIYYIQRENMTKYIFLLILLTIFSMAAAQSVIDLNTASLDQLKELPIDPEKAENIYNYRYYVKFLESIYELREIPGITQEDLNLLKPLVMVSHKKETDQYALRREQTSYLIERLGSNEGFQEGLSDIWEDYLVTPRNINKLTFSDVLNMPNTSPLDAAAVLSRISFGDSLSSYRDLRQTEGISYYGASNLRHYVYYEDNESRNKLFFNYRFKYEDNPYEEAAEDMYRESMIVPEHLIKAQTYWGYFSMEDYSPSVLNKIRVRYGNTWGAGFLQYNRKGEKPLLFLDDDDNSDYLKDLKYYANYERELFGDDHLNIVVGNFRAAFGEGLVMENSDFYNSRKTGYGFSKRITGITEDLSRTQEYALLGAAAEWKNNNFNGTIFFSSDDKDAVVYDSNNNGMIDDDDYLLSYITMTRRFTNTELEEAESFYENYFLDEGYHFDIDIAPRKDAFNEQILGGHFEYSPLIGTHLGITAYEAIYDRDFVVDNSGDSLKYLLITGGYAEEKYRIMDSEIAALYSTKTDSYDNNYRRVIGFDWMTVLNNTSIQGEYAELTVDGSEFKIGDDPKALILSTYTQFENLYLITLYRDYDLDFDNPYSRGFSEHEKFEDTVLEKYAYTLNNPLIADLYINSAQAQAERGVYIEARYKFNKHLTINRSYLDIWERKADSRKSVRFQGELDYRPVYALSMRLKYKHQQNRYDDDAERGLSKTNETTAKIVANLSNFDRISIEYRYSKVWFPPYTYLTNDPESGANTIAQAQTLLNADYVCVDYTHNFNSDLKVQGSFIYWNGHGASHWDWEDMEIDFMGEKGNKYWFALHTKISSNLYLTLKYKVKNYICREYEWRAWWNDVGDLGDLNYLDRVERTEHALRLNIDLRL